MPTKFIDGTKSLAEIELAIANEELSFRVSTGSTVRNQGQAGNMVNFEPAMDWPGEFKLTAAAAATPPGFKADWSADMLISGGPTKVTAWRKAPASATLLARDANPVRLLAMATGIGSNALSLPNLEPRAEPSLHSVDNNLLLGPTGGLVKQLASPNHGQENDRKYLIVHYTAGSSLEGAVSWFLNPAAKASAHLVIARDGSVVQMVRFDQQAWHAGKSKWMDINGMNAHSIGIELVNAGKLRRSPRGWVNWAENLIPDDEVTVATHKAEQTPTGWHEYTKAQIEALLDVAMALHQAYVFKDILGHDDVAPGRKADPGPLFPMNSIRSRLFGRQ